jgi:hypothetical protein
MAIQFSVGNRHVGKIEFQETEAALRRQWARRTPNGFVMGIPARLILTWQKEQNAQPFVSNLRARIYVDDNSGTELGTAYDSGFYRASNPQLETDLSFEWRGTMTALQALEKRRTGGPAKLRFECTGEVCWAYPQDNHSLLNMFQGIPERIYGSEPVAYPVDTWAEILRNLGAIGNILVEIPLPGAAPLGWDEIYAALEEARRGLARGGEDGFKACVVAVRLALDKWNSLEAPSLGPGANTANASDRSRWTKQERIEGMRWQAIQLAHLAAHSSPEKWTRADAVLAITTLAALLGVRNG